MDIQVSNNSGSGKDGRRWTLALFGLPFALAGLGVLLFLAAPMVLDWHRMQSWEPVPAQVLAANLVSSRSDNNSSTTWRATARYRYSYGGNDYEGDRVAILGGGDNIGDFQQALGNRLQQARDRGEPITVYVNPEAPQQAVVSRDLRGGQLALLTVFGLVFAAVGIGLILSVLFARDGATGVVDPAAPWESRREWNSPGIRSSATAGVVAAWFFALVWCAISGVASSFALDEFLARGNKAALVVLLFDAVGAWLLVWAVRQTLAARRFGDLVLQLDPHPGSIGGDVAGMIDLPLPYDAARAVTMTLACQHVYVRRSGKNSETQRDAQWSDTRHFLGEPTANGTTRVYFRFPVPAGLPVSSAPSADYYCWNLDLECRVPGVDLSRAFEVPVFATATTTRIGNRVRESQVELLAHLERLMNAEQIPGGVAMDYHAGRAWKGGAMLALFGAIFALVPVLMYRYGGTSWPMLVLFGGVFGLVGLGCIGGGLWMAGNRLQVEIDAAGARLKRDLFGVRVADRNLPRASIEGIVARRGGSMSAGNRVTVFYVLALKTTDGSTFAIGDGFRGYGEAQRAAETVGTFTSLPFLGEQAPGGTPGAGRV